MFTVYHSNELEVLVKLCISLMELKTQKPMDNGFDPLAEHNFVVQRPEIFTYLKQSIAMETGIATRLNSRTIWKFIWDIGRVVCDDFPESSPFDKKPLTLNILSLFEKENFSNINVNANIKDAFSSECNDGPLSSDPGFVEILKYINGDDSHLTGAEHKTGNSGLNLPFIDNLKNDYSVRRYNLALSLADIYECYQIYRPDWIIDWSNGDTTKWLGENPDEDAIKNCKWVARLWSEYIINNCPEKKNNWDRANAVDHIIKALDKNPRGMKEKLVEKFTNDIFVFGASSLPPTAFEVLIALGQHLDVHFMLCNPCRNYWGDLSSELDLKKLRTIVSNRVDTSDFKTYAQTKHYDSLNDTDFRSGTENIIAHPLLLSLGRQGRDMLSVLTEKMYCVGDKEYVNEVFAFVPAEDDLDEGTDTTSDASLELSNEGSLLSRLQADILNGRTRQDDSGRYVIKKDDNSLRIIGCSGKLREIQELYDEIMLAFMQDEELTPRDMVVMIPNLKAYVPYIRAVFETNNNFVTKLRYRICDRSLKEENPCLNAISRMLSINDTPLAATELMELLGVAQIMRQYGLESEDLPLIKKFISDGNMVLGLCADDILQTDENLKLDDNFAFTIKSGVERELMGSMMPKLESDVCVPYLTGIDSHGTEILGHLSCFINDLNTLRNELNGMIANQEMLKGNSDDSYAEEGKTDEEAWRKFVQSKIIFRFFKFEPKEQDAMRTVSMAFANLRECLQHCQNKPPINLSLIRSLIDDAAKGQSEFSHFLDGSLNFCTFVPMRSIPFKHIFMVGLNDGDFPRSTESKSFDPMEQDFRPGDRSRRDDDRYMFMEGLTAAQVSLYISYCSRNTQNGSQLNPSVVVNELVDYIVSTSELEGDKEAGTPLEIIEKHVTDHVVRFASLNVFDIENFFGVISGNGSANTDASISNPNSAEQSLATKNKSNSRGAPSCQVFWLGENVGTDNSLPSSSSQTNSELKQDASLKQDSSSHSSSQSSSATAVATTSTSVSASTAATKEKERCKTLELNFKPHEMKTTLAKGLGNFMSGRMLPTIGENPQEGVLTIDASELCYFYSKGPIEYFRKKVLGLYDDKDHTIQGYEKFSLNNLEEYAILVQMIFSDEDKFNSYLENAWKKGDLPAYQLGQESIENYKSIYKRASVAALREHFCSENLTSDVEVELALDLNHEYMGKLLGSKIYPEFNSLKVHITGLLDNIHTAKDGTLECAEFWVGEDKQVRHFFTAGLKYLLLVLSEKTSANQVKVYTRDLIAIKETDKKAEKAPLIFDVEQSDHDSLCMVLHDFVAAYLVGRVYPLPIFINKLKQKLSAPRGKNGVLDGEDQLLPLGPLAAFCDEFKKYLEENENNAMAILGDGDLYLEALTPESRPYNELFTNSFILLRSLGKVLRLSTKKQASSSSSSSSKSSTSKDGSKDGSKEESKATTSKKTATRKTPAKKSSKALEE